MDNKLMPPPSYRHLRSQVADIYAQLQPVRPGDNNPKSSAQVDKVVSQHTGSQPYGELKLDGSRPYRIVVRFTKEEKDSVVRQAEGARMTVSKFVRLTVLKSPALDPERNSLLHKVNFELTKQGTNLNQIAKHLNGKTASSEQGESMLSIIARSLLSAHKAVQHVLAQGRCEP